MKRGSLRKPSSAIRRSTCAATQSGAFGTFQEDPVDVVLRFDESAAHDAGNFLFHPSQTSNWNEDGTITVRFRAGGIDEMCWHLVTWGESVTIEEPPRLRRRACRDVRIAHFPPWSPWMTSIPDARGDKRWTS